MGPRFDPKLRSAAVTVALFLLALAMFILAGALLIGKYHLGG
jgi:hypothetical protein